ncbi:hypothetical protein BURPS406E_B0653 [Burkholderia pseudomallei 406e]|uniref:Uncharacterized protein n=1 Tax=Burkholderia pseudomallei (strain 1106a) TaxID=357348 RepID=A3NQL6_BURP0|nr:hypothetical protein BURPS668_0340 [Burkholderia pseudomallei 668]ABN92455.1 hypothetical protein BURPS1106A_0353 [Burkholderia pseudomallei 1106a]ACQ95414.1 conserved hypothetical protein [Burkholderia pseudomallei MSHR346]EBA49153.1 conserved hypothetical protein [Burkholderia pseudomallei 305]EDO82894.1 hypothetical protein BURPS406E_B0653 [Burkholderia pseudomallei 406e]EDS86158.1 hypothetical protein BURPSS13_I0788 [Burkholderia pseudomallei S13]EDU09661.1 hypothetical protein BURPS16
MRASSSQRGAKDSVIKEMRGRISRECREFASAGGVRAARPGIQLRENGAKNGRR